MNEIDIWRAADEMMRCFGYNADYYADMRAEKADAEGKVEDAKAWRRVVQAIHQIDNAKPRLDDPLN